MFISNDLGEIVMITSSGVRSLFVQPRPVNVPLAFCVFEYVYFSRPDTMYEGINLIYILGLLLSLLSLFTHRHLGTEFV